MKDFFVDIRTRNPTIAYLESFLAKIDDRYETEHQSEPRVMTTSGLINMLPPKLKMDDLIQTYIDIFDCTYKILHRPHLLARYKEFCQNPSRSEPKSIVTILLCVASVSTLKQGSHAMQGTDSSGNAEARTWIDACENWLFFNNRVCTTLEDLQIRCLLYLAKRANFYHKNTEHHQACNLVQLARSQGLHRESSLLVHQPTTFEQEMRRRVWAAINVVALEACSHRGFPPTFFDEHSDCTTPLNAMDEDISGDPSPYAGWQDPEEFTPISYIYWSQQMSAFRAQALSIVNGQTPFSFQQAMSLHEKLERFGNSLPEWAENVESWNMPHTNNQEMLVAALLELQLLELSLLLFYPFAHHQSFAAWTCLRSAERTIDLFSDTTAIEHGLALMQRGTLRAALCITKVVGDKTLPRGQSGASRSEEDAMLTMEHSISLCTVWVHYFRTTAW